MAEKKPKQTMVKGGYFYRRKKGGGPLLRIRKKKPEPTLGQRVTKDPALLQKYRSDPALRSKLADKYLTPDLLKLRRNNQLRADLGDITTPLTGDTMVRTANTLVDQEYEPQFRELNRSDARIQGQSKQQQEWNTGYNDYLGRLFSATIGNQGAQNQAAVGAEQAAGQQTVDAIQQAALAAQQRASQDAGVRGQGLGAGSEQMLAGQQQQAQQRAIEQASRNQTVAQQQGDAMTSFLRALASSQALRTQEQNQAIGLNERNRLTENENTRADLRRERPGKLTETLLKMRGDEVERYLTEQGIASQASNSAYEAAYQANKDANATAPDGVHTMSEWLAASPAQRAAWQKQAASGKRAPAKKPEVKMAPDGVHTMKEWLAASPAQRLKWKKEAGSSPKGGSPKGGSPKKSGPKWQTPNEQGKIWGNIQRTASEIRRVKKTGGSAEDVRNDKNNKTSGAAWQAAYEMGMSGGYIRRSTARRLHAEGLQIKGRAKVISDAEFVRMRKAGSW